MKRGTAEIYFEQIKQGGIEALSNILQTIQVEGNFIDAKQLRPQLEPGKELDDKDKEHLSKCMSAFGNGEGGLIIWGAVEDKATKQITLGNPFGNIKRATASLQTLTTSSTTPPHESVQSHPVVNSEGSDKGYIVTLIPRSRLGPLRDNKSNRYFIRSGEGSVDIPHSTLASMFRGRPEASLSVLVSVSNVSSAED